MAGRNYHPGSCFVLLVLLMLTVHTRKGETWRLLAFDSPWRLFDGHQ
jgi:hypothetical protein